jgi:peptidoglycan/LPS O-acetylase OafA/YrhL
VGTYSARRVSRLLVPYLAIGLTVLLGKMVAIHFVHVDNPPASFLIDAEMLVLVPIESVARFLWFIYVLSIYLMLVPAILYVIGRRPWILLIAGIVLQLGSWPEDFMIDWAVLFFPFFAGGMVLWLYRPLWSPMPTLVFWLSAIVFVGLLVLATMSSVPKWLTGACSMLPVLGLMSWLPAGVQSALAWLGKYSLSIYLFNELAMGVVKGVLFKVVSWDGGHFLFYFPLLALVGIGVPLGVKYVATRYVPRLAIYF